uniref:Putative group v salivary lipocalin lipocalin n=1 Tax=Hyalomma excavatum TaxID=257692 RepID=A0A131XHW7_9ACAR
MKYTIVEAHLMKAIVIIATTITLYLNVNAEASGDNTGGTGPANVLRIVDVFNRSEVLWQYWKNYTDDSDATTEYDGLDLSTLDLTRECTFIKTYNITSTDVNFWWNTLVINELSRSHYYGVFFAENADKLGSMNVTDISEGEKDPFEVMKLVFYNGLCSVFFVASLEENGDAGCELYLPNSRIAEGPTEECIQYFDKYCMSKTQVYESTCPDKVEVGEEELKKIMNKKDR